MYNATNAQPGGQPGSDGGQHTASDNNQSGDDVTDVDFEEVK